MPAVNGNKVSSFGFTSRVYRESAKEDYITAVRNLPSDVRVGFPFQVRNAEALRCLVLRKENLRRPQIQVLWSLLEQYTDEVMIMPWKDRIVIFLSAFSRAEISFDIDEAAPDSATIVTTLYVHRSAVRGFTSMDDRPQEDTMGFVKITEDWMLWQNAKSDLPMLEVFNHMVKLLGNESHALNHESGFILTDGSTSIFVRS